MDEEALQVINNELLNPRNSLGGNGVGDNAGKSIMYGEREKSNTVESVMEIVKRKKYHMFLAGRGHFPAPLMEDLVNQTEECLELGPIGDLLTSSTIQMTASVLVIQQHDVIHKYESAFSKNGEGSRLP
jgi:hypothetical protein